MYRPISASILLLPGFDESWVVQTVGQLQAQGCQTQTVSLKPRGVRGLYGLNVQADRVFPVALGQTHLLIPKCKQSLPTIMIEPRIHQLVQTVLADDGYVIVPPSVAAAFTRVGLRLPPGKRYHVVTSVEHITELIGIENFS